MATLTANGISIYYEIHGEGQPLILINGLKADHKNWVPVLEQFKQHYQVILIDNRGTGRSESPLPGYTVLTMAEDIVALIEQLNLKKPHVIGHSLGGAIAQTLAWRYPEKINKIVLSNTFPKLNASAQLAFETILDLHRAQAAPEFILKCILPWGLSSEFLSTPGLLAQILESEKQNIFAQTEQGYEGQYEALCQFDSRPFLSDIHVPSLIIAAEKDIIAPINESQELANKIPNALLKVVPGGHASPIEQTSLFIHDVLTFLQQ